MFQKSTKELIEELDGIRKSLKFYTELEKQLKEEITNYLKNKKIKEYEVDDYRVSLTITNRKGGLDEKAMIADDIPLENYRKPSIEVSSLKITKSSTYDM